MNYRHHFHAGNFADLVKHAGLLALLEALKRAPGPLTVIDTHAGAGLYDLRGEMAVKSGEAAAGVVRLMEDKVAPAVFEPLKAAVRRANPAGGLRFYPGSPALTVGALGPKDRLVACELRDEDARTLRLNLKAGQGVEIVVADGYATAVAKAPAKGSALVLIDPPFERADDYVQIQRCVAALLRRNRQIPVMVWLPLKDLETFDGLLRGLEDLDPPPVLVAEARLRPLTDPMKMNGCALLLLNAPDGLEEVLRAACGWVVSALGEPGGEARVWRL
ncbi:MAG TPA: 23S rRNA (adenine(2030)-N(6))-methyltransferase RlmJ [Caulobacteraceae bacterium]